MLSWVMSLFSKRASPGVALTEYYSVAHEIGGVLSTHGRKRIVKTHQGFHFDIEDPELYHYLHELEVRYADLGYRIIPLQDWIDKAGWDVPLKHLWKVKREENERPRFTKHTKRPELPRIHPLAEEQWKT
jgi:hypothetical protein